MNDVYIVALSDPDPHRSPRHKSLDDAREVVAKMKSRFPKSNFRIWRVNTDGSVVALSPSHRGTP